MVVCFVDDCVADGRVEVDVDGGHDAGEHLVAADDEEELDYLAGWELVGEGREGLVVDARSFEHFSGEAKHDSGVGAEARGVKVAALHGGDLLVVDAECLGDAGVLDPFVLCAGARGDERGWDSAV